MPVALACWGDSVLKAGDFPDWREGCCHLTCPSDLSKQRSCLAHPSLPKNLPLTEIRVT